MRISDWSSDVCSSDLRDGAVLASALGRIGVPSMAVTLGDAAILVVDAQLRPLVAASIPTLVDRLPIRVKVPRSAPRSAAFDVQPPAGVRHHIMGHIGRASVRARVLQYV